MEAVIKSLGDTNTKPFYTSSHNAQKVADPLHNMPLISSSRVPYQNIFSNFHQNISVTLESVKTFGYFGVYLTAADDFPSEIVV